MSLFISFFNWHVFFYHSWGQWMSVLVKKNVCSKKPWTRLNMLPANLNNGSHRYNFRPSKVLESGVIKKFCLDKDMVQIFNNLKYCSLTISFALAMQNKWFVMVLVIYKCIQFAVCIKCWKLMCKIWPPFKFNIYCMMWN